MGRFVDFDIQIFYAINGLAQRSAFWDQILILANKYGVVFFALVLVFYFFRNRQIFWSAAASAILSRGILTEIIRFLYHRPRPFVALENVTKLINQNSSEPSFPSGRAAFFFAIAFAVYLFDKKIGGILVLLALFLGLIRIYAGVHYPLDIIGGIAVAAFSVSLAQRLLGYQNRNDK